jgi:hypothetical protein
MAAGAARLLPFLLRALDQGKQAVQAALKRLPKKPTGKEAVEQQKLKTQLAQLRAEEKEAKRLASALPGRYTKEQKVALGQAGILAAVLGGPQLLDRLPGEGPKNARGEPQPKDDDGGSPGGADTLNGARGDAPTRTPVVVNVGRQEDSSMEERPRQPFKVTRIEAETAKYLSRTPVAAMERVAVNQARAQARIARAQARAAVQLAREQRRMVAIAEAGATVRQLFASSGEALANMHPATGVALALPITAAFVLPAFVNRATEPVHRPAPVGDRRTADQIRFERESEEYAQAVKKRTTWEGIAREFKALIPDKNLPAGPVIMGGAGSVAAAAQGQASLPGHRGVGAATAIHTPGGGPIIAPGSSVGAFAGGGAALPAAVDPEAYLFARATGGGSPRGEAILQAQTQVEPSRPSLWRLVRG